MMNNIRVKFFGLARFILVFGLIVAFVIPVYAQEAEDNGLNQILKKIENNKRRIREKTRQKKIAEQELGEVAQELHYTELNLRKTEKNLAQTQQKVQKTQSELTKTKAQFGSKKQQFSKRLVEVYKNRNLGFLEFVFAPTSMMSILDSSYYFEKVIGQDVTMIQGIRQDYNSLQTETKKLETQKRTLAQINREIQINKLVLSHKKKQQQTYVQSLHAEIAEMERMNRDLERASQEITNSILRLGKGTEYYGTGRFVKPVSGFLSSLFGYRVHPIFKRRIFHNGIDFAASTGTPIRAADSGLVIVAGEPAQYRGYGKITVIDHGQSKNGRRLSTVYAHQSRIGVHEGQRVAQGEVIGYVGSTGHSTGPHLHFEVRLNGVPTNPLEYLRL
jgi:murein DD-endopeptidase MepM/ murein hydrolase activator NlpD